MRNARAYALGLAAVVALGLIGSGCSVVVASTTTLGTSTTTSTSAVGSATDRVAQVVRVIDGDSLELNIEGESVEARLFGVNAPELFNGANQRTCNGEMAKAALARLVERPLLDGGAVQGIVVEGTETDPFGRLLVELWVENRSVSDSLIDEGWMLVTNNDGRRRQALAAAVEAKVGMFGSSCGEPNTKIGIGEVQANPPGNDRTNLTEEWVELVNRSEDDVELSGWVLRDETTGHIFDLGPAVLGSGDAVKVRTGKGSDTSTDLYLNETFPVWSNTDETVLLIDPKGVVAEVFFLIGVGE